MGLTKLTTNEVIRDDETHLQNKGSTGAYATNEVNATNKHSRRLQNQQTVGGTLKLLYKVGGVT